MFGSKKIKKSLDELREILNYQNIWNRQNKHPNPFCKFGSFGFSQTDEDGLTIEILKRLKIEKGTFCEVGVGDGTQNNSLILLAMGWKGVWIGNQNLIIDTTKSKRLKYIKSWVTRENIVDLLNNVDGNFDVLSIDLDGNDIYLIDRILYKGHTPKLFITEYNAKFPPNINFKIDYNKNHFWANDDYFGASLKAYVEVFKKYKYELVCCNAASGTNAFFIKEEYMNIFPEVPKEIEKKYSSPYYFLPHKIGHKVSLKTINKLIK